MTTPGSPQGRRVGVELLGLVVCALGVFGLNVCAFLADDLLGWAAVSATAVTLGAGMMFER